MATIARRVVKGISSLLVVLLSLFGLLGLPSDIANQVAFLQSLNEEWRIRVFALVLAFILALIAIGPHRVQEWVKWASPGSSALPEGQPAIEPDPPESTASPNASDPPSQVSLNQRSNIDLKAPCFELSEELFRFVGERDKEDPVTTAWIADASDAELNEFSRRSTQYMNETMHLYDQRYAGRVMGGFNR